MKALQNLLAVVLIVGVPTSACSRQSTHAVPAADRIELHSPAVVLPLKLYGGRPVVALTINGRGPYDFILDTGAHISIIDPALATELHLTKVGDVRVGSPEHPDGVPSTLFKADRMTAGGLDISGLMIVGIRMPFSKSDAPRGALSPAQLAGYLITFDFAGKRFEFRPGHLPTPDGSTVFQYSADSQVPELPISISGKSLDVNLDLGSSAGLMLPSKYAVELPLNAKPKPVKTLRLVDGPIRAAAANLEGTLVLGRYTFKRPRITFADVGTIGSVGAGLLNHFIITLDATNRRIRLTN